jgi:hypothetical protein
VTSGKAAINPPNRSLRFATSEINTTTPAVSKYLNIIQFINYTLDMPIALSKIKGIIMRCGAIGFSLTWLLPS